MDTNTREAELSKLTLEQLEALLTPKQILFGREYVKDFNASRAARAAGYSEKTAYSIGSENLRKPEIKAYISKLLEEATLSPSETIKSISDIARADLKDYFVIRKTVHRPKLLVPLAEYIERKKDEIERAKYVHDIATAQGLLGENADEQHEALVKSLRYEIVQLEAKLAFEPNATVIVDGPETLVEYAELDLARLVQDKEAGRIKSYSSTENGPKVEMYAADAALRDVAKFHGLLKDRTEVSGPGGGPIETKDVTVTVVSTGVPFASNEEDVIP